MISCPACGGNLSFDIPTQQVKCKYCNNLYDPYQFDDVVKDAVAEKDYSKDYDVTVYTCPECGGEILGTDNETASFCSFCGASTIMFSRIQKASRPKYLIPFKLTKEDCKQNFQNKLAHTPFLPNAFKKAGKVDSFRGIYMPYWLFDVDQIGPSSVSAEKIYSRGNYTYTDYYLLSGHLDAQYHGLSYDASSSFADDISQSIAPYQVRDMKNFTPAYLSGFYADTADVASLAYEPSAEAFARINTENAYNRYFKDMHLTTQNSLRPTFSAKNLALYPVWFMAYRTGDRVCYATVNGQTGKISTDLPVSVPKFLLGSLLLALPLFGLFQLLLNLNTHIILGISLIVLFVVLLLLRSCAKKSKEQNDIGYLAIHNPGLLRAKQMADSSSIQNKYLTDKQKLKRGSSFAGLFAFGGYILIIFAGFISEFPLSSSIFPLLGAALVMVGGAICIPEVGSLKHKQGLVTTILSMVLSFITVPLVVFAGYRDDLVYIAVFLAGLAVCSSLVSLISHHNLLTTHEMPQFRKKGGDDRA